MVNYNCWVIAARTDGMRRDDGGGGGDGTSPVVTVWVKGEKGGVEGMLLSVGAREERAATVATSVVLLFTRRKATAAAGRICEEEKR